MSSKFVFDIEGLRELMKSPEMQGRLQEAGWAVVNSADGSCTGYMTDLHVAPLTAVCTVYPGTKEAGLDNYLNNTLLKATQSSGLSFK